LFPPKQDTFAVAAVLTVAAKAVGSVIVTVATPEHEAASVMLAV
jgi:hypothetical protein